MVDDEKNIPAFAGFTGEQAAASPPPPPSAAPANPATTTHKAPTRAAVLAGDGKRIIASPYAKKLASEAGVSLQVPPFY